METDPWWGPTTLTPQACWALLGTAQVGRLAVSVADRPDIFPINFLVDDATIVFRTAEGTKLAAMTTCPHVAFEVDSHDTVAGQAWSVVLRGSAHEITDLYDLLETVRFPLFPWQAGPKDRFVRIVATQITGRQFRLITAAAGHQSMPDPPRRPSE